MSGDNHANIAIQRSDDKKFDMKQISEVSLNAINYNFSPSPESSAKDNESIKIHRSDGLTHDIINVFKAKSDPRGADFHLQVPGKKAASLSKSEVHSLYNESYRPAIHTAAFSPSSVRIVHFADTHNLLDNEKYGKALRRFFPAGDIMIHSGDFSNNGTAEEYAKFDGWLESVSDLYMYRVVCIGNRDVRQFGNNWDTIKALLPHATHVLCHEEANILGLRIYCSPWHWGYKINQMLRVGGTVVNRYDDIPTGINILVTHSAAYGRLDAVWCEDGRDRELWGSKELLQAIKRVRPDVHLHGHVHECRGIIPAFGNSPLTLNSAMTDISRTKIFAGPQVIKATLQLSVSVDKTISDGEIILPKSRGNRWSASNLFSGLSRKTSTAIESEKPPLASNKQSSSTVSWDYEIDSLI
jgi:Icc-related predicted phosphoesterase